MSPHPGVAVGLQLHAHGELVALPLAGAALRVANAVRDAGDRLDVMSDFVRNDVGLREVARRAESLIEVPEEGEVEIHLPIVRAIERPHRRLSDAACGLRSLRE